MDAITEIGTIEIERSQQARWKSGELAPEWVRSFPQLFDEEDLRLTREQGRLGYHFVDWLAAIVLHHATGYLSVWNYERPTHARVEEVVARLFSVDVVALFKTGRSTVVRSRRTWSCTRRPSRTGFSAR